MNREEASFILANIDRRVCDDELNEALDMAIKALDQEPCDNAVSRQDVLDLAKKGILISNGNYKSVRKAINELPSVNPQPCQEKWIDEDDNRYICKECEYAHKPQKEPCEDEYIKVPKKALKYRTAGMVAYNVEWLKDHFDLERAVICGVQQPCDNAVSRQAGIDIIDRWLSCDDYNEAERHIMRAMQSVLYDLPPVNPTKTGHWIEHPEIETSTPEYLMFYECSECGDKQCFCKSDIHKKHFCNNCGCRMVEPQESEAQE